MSMRLGVALTWMGGLFLAIFLPCFQASAGLTPPALAATEEPTKPPYVFPTPIFIPTYPGEAPTAASTRPRAGTPAATLAPGTGEQTYTVEAGDSPWTIAQKLCGSGPKYTVILSANGLEETAKLRVGMLLKIPANCSIEQPAATASPAPASPTQLIAATPVSTASQSTPTLPVAAYPTPALVREGRVPEWVIQFADVAVHFVSGLLLLGSVLSGASAVLVFRRGRFLEKMTMMRRRIHFR